MSENSYDFVQWEEQFVCQERGKRVVHYFLKDSDGGSVLAVVGTERSLRHMLYVVSEEFLQISGSEKSINVGFKWRSRREVVDWLTSLTPKQPPLPDCSKSPGNESTRAFGTHFSLSRLDTPQEHLLDHTFSRKLKGHNSDIVWSGVSWACGKLLKHYPAFCRNGTTIAIHSFILVMANEENRYVAYLEDMYENKKGEKKVKVRWFHHSQEVEGVIRLPNPHPREVFITPYAQVISAECVDGPATVLTPEHYKKCLATVSHTSSPRVHLCFRQFKGKRVRPFDITKLRGYFDQTILSSLDSSTISNHNFVCHMLTGEGEEEFCQGTVKQEAKRTRSCRGRPRFVTNRSGVRISGQGSPITACKSVYQKLKFGLSGRKPMTVKYVRPQPLLPLPFKVDEKIELLCQDSGIRGCWFRCTVLQASQKQLKVQYDDLENEAGNGHLEEWVPAFRLAAPDKLGIRFLGRLTVRPCPPPKDVEKSTFEIGAPVDAWWGDGWWEGVVTGIHNLEDDSLQVYFPGEDVYSTVQRTDLRNSRDWVGNQWINIEAKPDIISSIMAAVSSGTKLSASLSISKVTESGGSAMSGCEIPGISKLYTVEDDKQEVGISDGPKWVNSKKRPWEECMRRDVNENGDDDGSEDNEEDENAEDTEEDDFEAVGQKCENELVEVVAQKIVKSN